MSEVETETDFPNERYVNHVERHIGYRSTSNNRVAEACLFSIAKRHTRRNDGAKGWMGKGNSKKAVRVSTPLKTTRRKGMVNAEELVI